MAENTAGTCVTIAKSLLSFTLKILQRMIQEMFLLLIPAPTLQNLVLKFLKVHPLSGMTFQKNQSKTIPREKMQGYLESIISNRKVSLI